MTFKTLISAALLVSSSTLFAQQGVSEREITIGQFAALTGPAAQLGLRVQAGEINADDYEWWKHFQTLDDAAKQALVEGLK